MHHQALRVNLYTKIAPKMQHFLSYLTRFSDINVLCIGDIMLDCFVYGRIDRISPEAPVPVFAQQSEKYMLGGAGNVINNLVALGVSAQYLGFVGDDEYGKQIDSLLADIDCSKKLFKIKGHPTSLKTRLIASNNHVLRLDREEPLVHHESILLKVRKLLEKRIQAADIVLLSDYAKGTLTEKSTPYIIELCQQYNKKVLIDPKGADYGKYRGATLVKPNLKEFSQATQMSFDPKAPDFVEQVKKGARLLFERDGILNLLITLSEHGMIFVPSNDADQVIQIPTEAKFVFDVSGAGDTSLSMLGVAIAAGAEMKDAMALANVASGIVIGKLGTATVTRDEIKQQLASKSPSHLDLGKKIVSSLQAAQMAQKLKSQGQTVGFTNGCFDLMHMGHLHSFAEAKKCCDALFVGVNSDQSVKRYKGESRPIQDEQTRATLIAALEYVDYVVVFDDDNALPLIEAIKPQVIAKEGYAIADWPEAQYVESYGGKAVTLPRLEGYSSSNTISKLKD